jgi:hypothetical protein
MFGEGKTTEAAGRCEACLHFHGCDLDDPDDGVGKCWLMFDENAEYGAPWISREDGCDKWEKAQ